MTDHDHDPTLLMLRDALLGGEAMLNAELVEADLGDQMLPLILRDLHKVAEAIDEHKAKLLVQVNGERILRREAEASVRRFEEWALGRVPELRRHSQ